jgi:signal transduction histidine kinase
MTAEPQVEGILHTPKQAYRYILILVAVMIVLISVYPFLTGENSYRGSADSHAAIEITGSFLGLIVGFAMVVRFFTLGNRFHLLVGLAFFVNGAEDLVHGLLSFEAVKGISGLPVSSYNNFIPGTYVAGRLMLGLLLIGALFAGKWRQSSKNTKKETFWFSISAIFIAFIVTFLAFKVQLPRFIYPDRLISRPVDLISAVVLFIAFLLILREYSLYREVSVWWISCSVAIHTVGQLMMSFSSALYDPFFDISHIYKVFGYAVPLLGFSLYQSAMINRFKKAEVELKKHRTHLEELVTERTSELQEVVNMMTHDLKTPLRGIGSLANWLSEDYKDRLDEKGQDYLNKLLSRSIHMHLLIDDILEYSRLSRMRINPRRLDSHQLVKNILGDLPIPTGVTVNIEGTLPPVTYDENLLNLVFRHLLDNAVTHLGKPGGEVTVSCKTGTGMALKSIEFSISDSGVGIDRKHFQRIFKMFQKLNHSTTTESTGIGLALVKKIVELNGGNIMVQSEIGKGSIFSFTVPEAPAVGQEKNDALKPVKEIL